MNVDSVRVSLRYNGPEVDDGTMPVKDILEALQGFAGAYNKVAKKQTPSTEHTLRVAAVEEGSFDLLILASIILGPANQADLLEKSIGAARAIISTIANLIEAKKHTEGKPYTFNVSGDNSRVNVFNVHGNSIEMALEDFSMLEEKLVDHDLHNIAKPLRKGQIDSATLSADGDEESISATIDEEERSAFDLIEESTTTTATMPLVGELVSLNKQRNSGSFKLHDGRKVPYRYDGEDETAFHFAFGLKGAVRVSCEAILDANFQPTRLTITEAEPMQRQLPDTWLTTAVLPDEASDPKGLLPGGEDSDTDA